MKKITLEEFKEKLFDISDKDIKTFKVDKPTIIKFGAEWCAPCRSFEPVLEDISNEYDGKIDVYDIDVDELHEIASAFNIRNIPTTLFISTDGTYETTNGVLPKSKVIEKINLLFNI